MKEKILELIYNYSANGLIADRNFIDKLVEIVVNHKRLDDYVKGNVVFDDTPFYDNDGKIRVANYNIIDKIVTANVSAVNKCLEMYTYKYDSFFDDFELIFFRNLVISGFVLHELEHADQNKIYNSNQDDTEANLIKVEFGKKYMLQDPKIVNNLIDSGFTYEQIAFYLKEQLELYKRYYEYNPVERLAEIRTHNILSDVIEPIKNKAPNLNEYQFYKYVDSLLSGYEYYNSMLLCPTVTYLNGMNAGELWSSFTFYDEDPNIMTTKLNQQHSLIERLSYGFPISYTEQEEMNKVLTRYDAFR